MKRLNLLLFSALLIFGVSEVSTAQNDGISESLGLYAFPNNNQDSATQDADEMACFKWAKEKTGYDPLNPPDVQAAKVDNSADGTAIRGAAGGAAAGAAIGAIAGDTGKGAAIGAVAGGLRGRRAKVVGDSRQQQQNNQAAAAKAESMFNDYKKAFSACLEAKGYTVK